MPRNSRAQPDVCQDTGTARSDQQYRAQEQQDTARRLPGHRDSTVRPAVPCPGTAGHSQTSARTQGQHGQTNSTVPRNSRTQPDVCQDTGTARSDQQYRAQEQQGAARRLPGHRGSTVRPAVPCPGTAGHSQTSARAQGQHGQTSSTVPRNSRTQPDVCQDTGTARSDQQYRAQEQQDTARRLPGHRDSTVRPAVPCPGTAGHSQTSARTQGQHGQTSSTVPRNSRTQPDVCQDTGAARSDQQYRAQEQQDTARRLPGHRDSTVRPAVPCPGTAGRSQTSARTQGQHGQTSSTVPRNSRTQPDVCQDTGAARSDQQYRAQEQQDTARRLPGHRGSTVRPAVPCPGTAGRSQTSARTQGQHGQTSSTVPRNSRTQPDVCQDTGTARSDQQYRAQEQQDTARRLPGHRDSTVRPAVPCPGTAGHSQTSARTQGQHGQTSSTVPRNSRTQPDVCQDTGTARSDQQYRAQEQQGAARRLPGHRGSTVRPAVPCPGTAGHSQTSARTQGQHGQTSSTVPRNSRAQPDVCQDTGTARSDQQYRAQEQQDTARRLPGHRDSTVRPAVPCPGTAGHSQTSARTQGQHGQTSSTVPRNSRVQPDVCQDTGTARSDQQYRAQEQQDTARRLPGHRGSTVRPAVPCPGTAGHSQTSARTQGQHGQTSSTVPRNSRTQPDVCQDTGTARSDQQYRAQEQQDTARRLPGHRDSTVRHGTMSGQGHQLKTRIKRIFKRMLDRENMS